MAVLGCDEVNAASRSPSWATWVSASTFVGLPCVIGVGSIAVHLTVVALAVVGFLLLALFGAEFLGAMLAARANKLLLAPAAAIGGFTFAWHFRETTWRPGSPALLLAFAVLTTGWLAVTVCAMSPLRISSRRLTLALVVLCLVGGGAAVGAYESSSYLRWALLDHSRTLGPPLYLLLGPDTRETAERARKPAAPLPVERPAADAVPDDPPNLVFVLVDTMRADVLPPWGGPEGRLPRLDRLASEATVLTNLHANSSWTRPSVASMFTGLLPEEHGARDRTDGLAPPVATLAERLRNMGYATAAFVSNYGAISSEAGFARGFDEFIPVRGSPYARASVIRARVEEWVRTAPQGKPYFLYVHFLDPHEPYLSGHLPATRRPEAKWPAYWAELEQMDGEIGRLEDVLLSATNRPTELLLTSDHGDEFGDHGSVRHGHSLYVELVHVPALLLLPGQPHRLVAAPLEARDFFDLLPALAGGLRDIGGWARARPRNQRYSSVDLTSSMVFWRPRRRYAALRRLDAGELALVWSAFGNTLELYDESADPHERDNLVTLRPDEAAEMLRQLQRATPPWTPSTPVGFDRSSLRQLQALGYLQ